MKTRIFGAITALVLGASPLVSAAPAPADERSAAANFFDAGAEAYDAGQYLVAAEAFLKAHDILKSPALLFSAAQAYRRQSLLDGSPDAVRRSVRLYRDYLRDDPSGNRREDAMSALTDLVPIEARLAGRRAPFGPAKGNPGDKPGLVPIPVPLDGVPDNGAADPAEDPADDSKEAPRATRLLLTAKPEMAEVSVDGAAFVRMPAVIEVKPGAHPIRMRAPGYHDEELTATAVQNELVARHVLLRPKPGRLFVTGTSGARVFVDGQARAILPLPSSLEIDPGEHFITVSRAGHVELGRSIAFERDREAKLSADLSMTGQRVAAWTAFGLGLAGAAAGGVLTGFVLDKDATASALEARRTSGTLTASERDQENAALSARNDFALAASVTGGAAALVLLTSVGLFMFDEPNPSPVPPQRKDTGPAKSRVDFTVGLSSAGMRVSF